MAHKQKVKISYGVSNNKKKPNKPEYQKNIEAWIGFFFRNSQNRLVDEQ